MAAPAPQVVRNRRLRECLFTTITGAYCSSLAVPCGIGHWPAGVEDAERQRRTMLTGSRRRESTNAEVAKIRVGDFRRLESCRFWPWRVLRLGDRLSHSQ